MLHTENCERGIKKSSRLSELHEGEAARSQAPGTSSSSSKL